MFTYTLPEFKAIKPEAYEQLERVVRMRGITNVLTIASVEGEKTELDVVVALPDRAAVVRLSRVQFVNAEGKATRFWVWTSRFIEEPETAVMNEYAQAAFDKFINALDANAKVFHVAEAGQNSFGTCAYEVVTTSQTEDGLKVNAFRVSARYGTQFRSGRWTAELL